MVYNLFNAITIKLLEVAPEIPNQVDEIIANLIKNPIFITALTTAVLTILNFITQTLRNKKVINREINNDKRNVAIGNAVEKLLNIQGVKIDNLIPLIEKVLLDNEDLKKALEKKEKDILLLLQSANIPINAKKDYLNALNDKNDDNIKDTIKVVKNAINNENEVIKVQENELDKKIADLKEEW